MECGWILDEELGGNWFVDGILAEPAMYEGILGCYLLVLDGICGCVFDVD